MATLLTRTTIATFTAAMASYQDRQRCLLYLVAGD